MSHTPDLQPGSDSPAGQLPVDPYRSLHVHFGMLLGVADFETLEAYHRGKMWLHSAWLHGSGTVWGLGVSLDVEHGEVRVARGLALDGLGRELHLEADACVNAASWFAEHAEQDGFEFEELEGGGVRFDAHVLIRFTSCLTRQVPAMSEPCEGSGATVAYSRVFETVELRLVPGPPPAPPPLPYHRLRLLFGLDDPRQEEGEIVPSDAAVIARRDAIFGQPVTARPQAWLAAFREFAALDQMEWQPAATAAGSPISLFPEAEPSPLVLAALTGITLDQTPSGLKLASGTVDNTVRRTHVATSTIQELLCGPVAGAEGAESVVQPPSGVPPAPEGEDAGGPRIDPTSVSREGSSLRMRVEGSLPLLPSLKQAVTVSLFDARRGWSDVEITDFDLDVADRVITVHLAEPPEGDLLRLNVRGTGSFPALGRNRVPLAGGVGGPAAGPHEGIDFVHVLKL